MKKQYVNAQLTFCMRHMTSQVFIQLRQNEKKLLMNLQITRRQIIVSSASALIATQAVCANVVIEKISETPQISRQLISWADANVRCLFEGQAEDVPLVVGDAQAIWSERALFEHVDRTDLHDVCGSGDVYTLSTLFVGSATSQSATDALDAAFERTGVCRLESSKRSICSALLLMNAPPDGKALLSLKKVNRWIKKNFYEDTGCLIQVLRDESLAPGSVRMGIAINTGVQQVSASEPIISVRNSLDSLDLDALNQLPQAKPLAA